jgi:hypothetical protein
MDYYLSRLSITATLLKKAQQLHTAKKVFDDWQKFDSNFFRLDRSGGIS